jgi:hypothetical protein
MSYGRLIRHRTGGAFVSWASQALLIIRIKQTEQDCTALKFVRSGDSFDGHAVTLSGAPHGNFPTDTIPTDEF